MPASFLSARSISLAAFIFFLAACAPPVEPTPDAEAPPPPPPAPTPVDIGEVDLVAAEPGFTSRHVTFMGVKIGDITNDMLILGEQEGETENAPEHYVSSYHGGGLVVHTFKNTGEIRKLEVLTRLAGELASPQLRAWLEEGDVGAMREFMGPEEDLEDIAATGATEYVYDARGIRFVSYGDQNGIRFSRYSD